MACHDGTIKILDLGLAISTPLTCPLGSGNESTTNLTAEGVIVGTIDYMSPEQRNGRQGVDARCDVYSLGCTMFFLLTGQAAFRDCGSDLIVRMAAHSIKPVAPLNQFRSDVPEDVEAIMRRMMAKAPDDRFQSAAELAKALTSIVNSYPKSDATSLRTPSSNLPPPVPFDHISPNVPPRRGDFPVPIPIPVPTKTMVPSNFFVNASSNRDIPGAPPARIGPQLPTPFKTVLPQREASASVSIAPVRDAKISKALSPAPNFPNIELPPVRQSLSETRQRPNMIMLYLTGTIVVATVIAAIVVLTLAYRRDAQTPNSHENTSKSLTYSNPCRIRNPWSLA